MKNTRLSICNQFRRFLKINLGYSNGTVDFTRRRIISLLFHFVLRFYLLHLFFCRFFFVQDVFGPYIHYKLKRSSFGRSKTTGFGRKEILIFLSHFFCSWQDPYSIQSNSTDLIQMVIVYDSFNSRHRDISERVQ